MLKIKHGVSPRLLVIAAAAANTAQALQLTAFVTSGSDGEHKPGSKHYTLEALDFRTRDLTSEELSLLVKGMKARLGSNYDFVIEPDHLHVEYDPK